MKMPKKLKDEWIEALESGEYEQGESMLRYYSHFSETETFCCLGVLCDIAVDGEWNGSVLSDETGVTHGPGLPRQRFILNDNKRVDIEDIDMARLVDMNDGGTSRPKTFKQIARWIKENVEAT